MRIRLRAVRLLAFAFRVVNVRDRAELTTASARLHHAEMTQQPPRTGVSFAPRESSLRSSDYDSTPCVMLVHLYAPAILPKSVVRFDAAFSPSRGDLPVLLDSASSPEFRGI